jgi:hypothetical protein
LFSPVKIQNFIDWKTTCVGEYNLYVHPDSYLTESKSISDVFLVGTIIDPDNPEWTVQEIVNHLSKFSLIEEITFSLYRMVGRFVLFVFERYWDVHTANRWIPALIPMGLLALLVGGLNPIAALVFVVLFGLGNGMNTIVKGTAMAQYVSRDHVGQLNGLLGLPIALARAAAPLAMGLMWSPQQGYAVALQWLLVISVVSTGALWMAQRKALR